MPEIRAVIFDMDGLLIDSEPLWQDAEIEAFRPLGIPVTRELCRQTAGTRLDEVLKIWHEKFRWQEPGLDEMHRRILAGVTKLMMEQGQALPGVHETMRDLRAAGIPMAIASSSPPALIQAVVDKLELEPYLELTHSGIHEEKGKPDPAVFLTTAARLGIPPEQCLVFEDAPNGVLAAHRAGMPIIAIPSVFDPDDPGFEPAWRVLDSLNAFTPEMLDELKA